MHGQTHRHTDRERERERETERELYVFACKAEMSLFRRTQNAVKTLINTPASM